MKKQKGYITIAILPFIFLLFMAIGWSMNIYKFTQCDFEAPYKAEVIHAIGIIPVVGMITGWMDFGK